MIKPGDIVIIKDPLFSYYQIYKNREAAAIQPHPINSNNRYWWVRMEDEKDIIADVVEKESNLENCL